jgi:hypothetical protein
MGNAAKTVTNGMVNAGKKATQGMVDAGKKVTDVFTKRTEEDPCSIIRKKGF